MRTYTKTITEHDVYDMEIELSGVDDAAGYEAADFRPPLKGEQILTQYITVETASYDYPATSPRLILRKIQPREWKFREISRDVAMNQLIQGQEVFLLRLEEDCSLVVWKATSKHFAVADRWTHVELVKD